MSIYTLALYLPLLALWAVAWIAFVHVRISGSLSGIKARKKLGAAVFVAGIALLLFVVVRGLGAYLAGSSGIAAIPVKVSNLSPTFGINETVLLLAVLGAMVLFATGTYMVRSKRLWLSDKNRF